MATKTAKTDEKSEDKTPEAGTDLAAATGSAIADTAEMGDFDYGEDAGAGFENTSGSDLSIPFMNVLQSNSPDVQQCQDGSIILGMFKNTVTGEYTKRSGFVFLPVHKEEAWVEWIPRAKGGGFVGLHAPDSEAVLKAIADNGGDKIPKKGADGKKVPLKVGANELVETYYVYGLLLDDTGLEVNGFAVIAFTSTKIKPYRDWLTSMFMIKGKPPMYAIRARISSEIQTNESGTFANIKIAPFAENNWMKSLVGRSSPVYAEGKRFQEMVVNGMARADFSKQDNAHTADGGEVGSRPSAGANGNREETPF